MTTTHSSGVARERPISVFVSSRISPAYEWARLAAFEELKGLGLFDPWLFEVAPASTEGVQRGYLRRVAEADLVLWLVGRETTEPVLREIRTAIESERPILVFRIDDGDGDSGVEELIGRTGGRWSRATSPVELRSKLAAALQDELVRGYRQRPPTFVGYLERLHRASVARCVERWLALGISEDIARSLAADATVGALLTPRPGLTILIGPVGAGKSLAAERVLQHAISGALREDHAVRLPLFFEARAMSASLDELVRAEIHRRSIDSITAITAVIDGLDEAPDRESSLLTDANRLVLQNPSSVVVLTTRRRPPRIDCSSHLQIVEAASLTEAETVRLISLVAGRAVSVGEIRSLSDVASEAAARPLFAILAGQAAREGWLGRRSLATLLREFVERSVGALEARQCSAEPMLRRLASRSLDLGRPFLAPQAVGAYHELAPLFRSRLVVERDGNVGFPLSIFAHWFAAQSISAGEIQLEVLLADEDRATRWFPAIELQMNLEPDRDSTTRVLAARRPGIASQVIDQRDTERHGVAAPDAAVAGAALRDAVNVWGGGLGKAAVLTTCMDPACQPRHLAIRVSGDWVETAWLPLVPGGPEVVEVTESLFGERSGWNRRSLSTRGATWHSVWRRSLDELRFSLADVVKAQAIPVPDALLPEAAWYFARHLLGIRGLGVRAVPLDNILQVSGRLGRTGTLALGRRRFGLDDVHNRLVTHIEHELGGLARPPWPGPDRLASGDIANCFDDSTLLRRTQMVYDAAFRGYIQIVDDWFAGLLPDLERRREVCGQMRGIVCPKATGPNGTFPALAYTQQASSGDGSLVPDLTLGSERDFAAFREEALQSSIGYTETVLYDVLSDDAATDLVYTWLERDLRDLHWLRH